jgi:hypothetical protein
MASRTESHKMPWQDAPLVDDPQQQGWRAAPLAPQDGQTRPPSPLTTSAPISPATPGGAGQGPGNIFTRAAADQPASFTQAQGDPSSLGQMGAFDPRAANSSWSDFLLAHMAEAGKGAKQIGQSADDYVRAATNTFGLGDRLAAGMNTLTGVGGGDLAMQRAETAAANERLGPAVSAAANMTGYGPLASLGIAGRAGAGVLGRIAGSGVETAAGGAIGGAAQSQSPTWGGVAEDAAKGAALQGAIGVGSGAAGAIVNPLARMALGRIPVSPLAANSPAAVTAALKDTRDQAYAGLKDVFYNPNDLAPHLDGAVSDIQAADPAGELTAGAPRSMAALNGLMDRVTDPSNPTQTAHSVLSTIDKLSDIQRGPNSGAENDIAPLIKDRLNDFLQTANPVNPDLGPGAAAKMISNAQGAHQLYANARDLQGMSQNLSGFGTSPAGQARKISDSFYTNPNTPQYQALSNIALAGGGGQTAYNVMHMVDPLLGYAGASVGGGPGALAGEIVGHAMKPTIGSMLAAGQQAKVQAAIANAYPTLTGGRTVGAPQAPNPAAALRALLFGQAAGVF